MYGYVEDRFVRVIIRTKLIFLGRMKTDVEIQEKHMHFQQIKYNLRGQEDKAEEYFTKKD